MDRAVSHPNSDGSLRRGLFIHVAREIVHIRDMGKGRRQKEDGGSVIVHNSYCSRARMELHVFREIHSRKTI
ncbi:MAG: hypothetical protein HW398_1170, partial [Acidobacteria bacterium]|nr:hypothetical protein [Acidobacteriota bacterium]